MKKRTLFLGFLLMLALSTAALAADYTDVPADSWARESIDKAAEYGLMNGVGEGRFGLGETISREQFVTILVRMFGWESVSGEDAAVDIADSWAREFVNTAAANGVIDAGGKFRPRDAITRREMAVMLVRALGLGVVTLLLGKGAAKPSPKAETACEECAASDPAVLPEDSDSAEQ